MRKLLYIDLFCGAGGTSTGVESATLEGQKCAHVIACVNHDPHAIASHLANHPEAKHYTEDIRTLDLTTLVEHTARKLEENPGALLVLWASLECTNFSRAKGGQPRDADSRTLAEHLFRYIDALKPDYIQIENVREFMMWGDLDQNGKPVSKDAGRLYLRWVQNVCQRGYDFDHRILNAADYGAYTSRERFFGVFACKGLPIVFPEPTHGKDAEASLFPGTKPWKPVREVLDLNDHGRSIFRDKPLSEKTLQRIYAGLVKFVAGGKDQFLMRYNTVRPQDTVKSIEQPCGVLTTENRFAKVKAQFLSKQFSGSPDDKNISIDGPAGTVTCVDHHAFITAYYGNGNNTPIDKPAPTVTTKDRLGLVRTQFMDQQYGTGRPASLNRPAGTITTNPKLNLISVKPWIMDTSFDNVGSSIDEPSRVITANRKWHYLVNPQFASAGASIEKPCFTLIARMDKRPPYIVTAETGPAIVVYDGDSPMTIKIKEFMALYGISDICMRMLNITELKKIMGFPDDYVLVGTQTEQKKYIFLLSKSKRYYFDNEAVKEPAVGFDESNPGIKKGNTKSFRGGNAYTHNRSFNNSADHSRETHGNTENLTGLRNRRSVWSIAPSKSQYAHFATFPEKLVQPCILAGCPEDGIVLDPFMGTGTTGLVARKLHRNYVGIELNPTYQKIAEQRIANEGETLFNQNGGG